MTLRRLTRTLSLVASVLGVFLSGFLTRSYYTGTINHVCAPDSGCETVLTSAYSHFLGLPTAFYGLLYFFTVLALLLVFPYVKREGRQFFFTLGLALHAVALLISLFLITYSVLALSAICPVCLISTGLVIVLFGITLYWKVADVDLEILEQQSTELWKGAAVFFVLILILVSGLYYRELTTPDPDRTIHEVRALTADVTTLGNPDAPVRVIEFYDLACPYCRRFALETFPEIKEKYIDTGRVSWTFRPFPDPVGHKHSLYAHAFLTRVADENFLAVKNEIMRDADRWIARRNETPQPYFYELAKKYNLPKLKQPPRSIRRGLLMNRRFFRRRIGIEGTPSYLVNGKIYEGVLNFREWRNLINKILGNRATESLID